MLPRVCPFLLLLLLLLLVASCLLLVVDAGCSVYVVVLVHNVRTYVCTVRYICQGIAARFGYSCTEPKRLCATCSSVPLRTRKELQ